MSIKTACEPRLGTWRDTTALAKSIPKPLAVFPSAAMKVAQTASILALAGQALGHGYIYRVTADNTV